MLDKGQIKDWDGEPEAEKTTAPVITPPTTDASPMSFLHTHREAVPTGEFVTLTAEQKHARKRRGQWIALALFAFVILLFVLTVAKVGGNVMNWGTAFE